MIHCCKFICIDCKTIRLKLLEIHQQYYHTIKTHKNIHLGTTTLPQTTTLSPTTTPLQTTTQPQTSSEHQTTTLPQTTTFPPTTTTLAGKKKKYFLH